MGVVAEPTSLVPVYAHKGSSHVIVEATGKAAHTSTELGVSANFLIAPFLAEMAELNKAVKTDERFINREFNPPTNGFNMTINDFGTKQNVFAAHSSCYICFRTMPGDKSEELVAIIEEKARKYDLEVVDSKVSQPFYVEPSSEVVRIALEASNNQSPSTVPYGTDALQFHDKPIDLVVLGPGSIEQAHTVGEYVDVPQLYEAVEVYKRMIDRVCL
jgi:acetylornithine deacetylase